MKNLRKAFTTLVAFMVLAQCGITPSWADMEVCPKCRGGGGPPAIRLLSHISTANQAYGSSYVNDMQLIGTKLYTASYSGDPVYDVSNPRQPFKSHEIPANPNDVRSFIHRAIEVVGNRYYALGDTDLEIWNLSGTTYLGGTSETYDMMDFDVNDHIAYIVVDTNSGPVAGQSGSLSILDVSNPASILHYGGPTWSDYPDGPHPPNPSNVIAENHVGGVQVYIGMEGLRIYRAYYPYNPTFVSRFDAQKFNIPQEPVHPRDDMEKVGNRIYKAHRAYGVLVLDVQFVSFPTLQAVIGEPVISVGDLTALEVVGNRAFVATRKDRQLKILDITNLNVPKVLASTNISNVIDPFDDAQDRDFARALEIEIDVTRKLAFVAGEKELNIYDVSDFLQ